MIDITRPVSLNVKDEPIENVLATVGKQVNVNFKMQARHIVVKGMQPAKEQLKMEGPAKEQPVVAKTLTPPSRLIDTPLLTSVSRTIPARPTVSNRSILESRLDRRIRELQETLGPNVPRDIPAMYVNRVNFNNRGHGWFASVGMVLNDQSGGFEVQGGVRYLYAVIQPRWSIDRGFFGLYGAGSAFNLRGNFSFNTIYLYSGNKQSATIYPFSPLAKLGPEFQLTETGHHHQVKFALQYSFSPKVVVRLGPVLNYKSTTIELVPTGPETTGYLYETRFIYRQPGTNIPDIVYENGKFLSQTVRQMQSWIGWEGAVTYRLNFSKRP